MKKHIRFCLLFITYLASIFLCQGQSNTYEIEEDKFTSKVHPEYYNALKTVISDFENYLVTEGILKNSTNKSYIKLLKAIKNGKASYKITYPFQNAISKISGLYETEQVSIEKLDLLQFFNAENSKSYAFSKKIHNQSLNEQMNSSLVSETWLGVFNAKDLDLPLIKLQLLKLIDPNPDDVLFIYVGKPTKD